MVVLAAVVAALALLRNKRQRRQPAAETFPKEQVRCRTHDCRDSALLGSTAELIGNVRKRAVRDLWPL